MILIDQNTILHVLLNISRTDWLTKILMSFLSFSDNLLRVNHTCFQNIADDFEITHKTCSITVLVAILP